MATSLSRFLDVVVLVAATLLVVPPPEVGAAPPDDVPGRLFRIERRLELIQQTLQQLLGFLARADLLPLPNATPPNPAGTQYCSLVRPPLPIDDSSVNLQVRVGNRGYVGVLKTTTRVAFTTSLGNQVHLVETPEIPGNGGTADILVAVPFTCWEASPDGGCRFSIIVDWRQDVEEGDEVNNTVAGGCSAIL